MFVFRNLKNYRWFILGGLFLLLNAYGVLHHAKEHQVPATSMAQSAASATNQLVLTTLEPSVGSSEDLAVHAGFTAQLNIESAATFIEISPQVAFRTEPWVDWDAQGCQIVGAFQPGSVYRITFHQGLKATNGAVLRADITRVVSFPDRPASIAFHTAGHYLSDAGNLLVAITTVNIHRFTATVERVYPNNLVYFAMRESGNYPNDGSEPFEGLTHEVGHRSYRVDALWNQSTDTLLDLHEFLRETPSGVFRVTVATEKGVQASHLVVTTDIGIVVKLSPNDLLVWANSIHSLNAVTGAEVRVYSKTNQEIVRGMTDTNGLARFDAPFNEPKAEPFLVTVSKGDELSYLKLDGTRVETVGDTGGRPYVRRGYEAYLFTDRGIYRPGETAHLKAVVRDCNLSCPPPFPVQLFVLRPDGKCDRLLTGALTEFGTVEFAIEWPDYAATGTYQLQLKLPGQEQHIGSMAIALEEFVPPQIAVTLHVEKSRAKAGEPLNFQVAGQHLFGRPAAGNVAAGTVEFLPEPFSHPDWPGYVFADVEKSFVSVRQELGRTQLDANGQATFSAEPLPTWRPPSAMKAIVVGSVMEGGGRTVSACASRFVDVYPFYIGLRMPGDGGALMVGQTQTVAVATVKPDGTVETGTPTLKFNLNKITWSTILKKDSDGRYAYQSERQLTVVTDDELHLAEGKASATFALNEAGQYLLTVRDPLSGSSSSLNFYVGSPEQQWLAWSLETPDRVELTLDKGQYDAGEDATLLIKSPYAGMALLTIESDRVLEQRVLLLEKNTTQVTIPVVSDYRPNVYCSVSVIRPVQGGEKWAGHRAVGSVPLMVNAVGHHLDVKLNAPSEMRPKQLLSVTVETGVPAEVVVAAVDEGICALTDFTCPDPLAYFSAKRQLSVDLFDMYGILMPEVEDGLRGTPSEPGGDNGATMLRRRLNPISARRFKPVALWSSTACTDTNGRATVEFDVPEFTGQLRLMAVAIGPDGFGTAQQSVLVKRPLVVRSSLPRFLAPSDRCRMPVQIFNETGSDGEAVVQLSCRGLTTPISEKRILLKAGEDRSVDFELSAGPQIGGAMVTLQVALGAEQYTEDIEMAVRPPAGRIAVAGAGSVSAGQQAELRFPSTWLPGTAQQELLCSGMPTLELAGGLDYLLRYPYGCIEQTTSASFPLLYLADLAAQLRPGSIGHEETGHFVQAGIQRILSMQLSNGGFGMWPGSNEPWDWGSVYATHFLAEATRAGYLVPSERLGLACDYVRGLLSKRVDSNDDLQQRAYACLVLAAAGKPEHGWLARLQEQRALLGTAAQANLAAALAAAGRRRDAGAFLSSVEAGGDQRPRRAFGSCLSSTVRDQALLLSAWLELDPDNPTIPALVRRLEMANVNGRWYTTHENALALMALGKYARVQAAKQKPFTGAVS